MRFYRHIESVLSEATGRSFAIESRSPIGGGCISAAERLTGSDRDFFLKTNEPSFLEQFEAEQDSLDALDATQTIRVPKPIVSGRSEGRSYLVLEYIATGSPSATGWQVFGQRLAALHKLPQSYYGWKRPNVIGSTFQSNRRHEDWIEFWREERLEPQIRWASEGGLDLIGASELLERLPAFFADYTPSPALLHGDLWSGNAAFDENGQPFIYDPCCYFGDRETDLAFTEFFGGFPREFYDTYNEALPLISGYERRKTLYNLYHCLNHFNLFGSAYARQAQAMTDELLPV